MDIKLFSLCKEENEQIITGQKHILKCVRNFFTETENFTVFTSQKRMLLAASQSLRAADIVIIAVQNNMYNATKRLLAQALDFKMMKNNTVFNALNPLLEKGKITQTALTANIAFPQGAKILPTDDMFNCGFVLSAGAQHIVFLPVESPRADEVVYGSLFDFLASICEKDIAEKGLTARHRAVIKRTADKLDTDSVKVSFAPSRAASFIEGISAGIASKHCFSFNPENEYNESTPDNLVDKARQIKDNQFASFGVVFSDIIFTNEDKRQIKIAIADETGTNTYTFFALADETDSDFIANCVDKTMLILYNHEKFTDSSASADTLTKSDKALHKLLYCVAGGVAGVSALIGIVISLLN